VSFVVRRVYKHAHEIELTSSTIIVVGAGRGPLVACALRALKRANREAAVYAVEKNANAFITSVASSTST
jgi:hypothetical protein